MDYASENPMKTQFQNYFDFPIDFDKLSSTDVGLAVCPPVLLLHSPGLLSERKNNALFVQTGR
jgi:hypothetical protein